MGPATIFCDIDGCLLYQGGGGLCEAWPEIKHDHKLGQIYPNTEFTPKILPGVREKFNEWSNNHCRVILTTGRPESMRRETEDYLNKLKGIWWDHLIMGIGHGPRYLINDMKENNTIQSAFAINLKRNEGLINVEI